eukprot:c27208_g1_i1.p3 GENE.c27208_g1_i1~~c27208_g1_i1.p3  ORF type:complete len:218 (+),score=52.28 c27208_g1_i1:1-654(+)
MALCAVSFVLAAIVEANIASSCCNRMSTAALTRMQANPHRLEGDCALDMCVSMWWQLPQYIVITAAEVLFSVSGLEFAYSQAPQSLKGVVSASWLLTIAVANLFVAAVAEVRLGTQTVEYLLYAALVAANTCFFVYLARRYIPNTTAVARGDGGVVDAEEEDCLASDSLLGAEAGQQDAAAGDADADAEAEAEGSERVFVDPFTTVANPSINRSAAV